MKRARKFGRHEISEEVYIRLGPYELAIVKTEKGYMYRRFRESEVTREVLIPEPGGKKLHVYPAPPVIEYQEVTKHVLLRMPEPVVLSPGESVTFYATTPVDVLVDIEAEGERQTIDWFMPAKFKLSVYGTIDEGLLCRSYHTKLSRDISLGLDDGEAVFKLVLRNSMKKPVTLTKLVLPAEQMSLYYDDERAFLEDVEVVVKSGAEAQVNLLNRPPVSGLAKAPTVFKREEKEKWTMTYGY